MPKHKKKRKPSPPHFPIHRPVNFAFGFCFFLIFFLLLTFYINKVKSTNQAKIDDNKSESGDFEENESTLSNPSSTAAYQDLDNEEKSGANNNAAVDSEQNQIDNTEIQLGASLQGMQEKNFKEREDGLKVLNKLFATKYVIDHLIDKRFTLVECIHRCLKRGKLNEQVLAARALALLFIQFGYSNDSEYLMNETRETLVNFIKNDKLEAEVRAACCRAIGLAQFIANDSPTSIHETMSLLEGVFQGTCLKGDQTVKQHTKEIYQMHIDALASWSLLFSVLPLASISSLILKRITQLQDFLKSPDVELRITAGETIAILFEIGHCDANLDIGSIDSSELIEILNNLAKESGKSKSKKDRRVQHSSFRDILRTIEDGDLPDVETVKFGHNEELQLDNWVRTKHYKTFRDMLGTGITCHLQENELLRDVFDLGPVQLITESSTKTNASKTNKKQRALENNERFRYRTKTLQKRRDQKRNMESETTMVE